jgi:hypothetical protein
MTSGRPFVLTKAHARLEATYTDALVRAGWPVDTSRRWGCRAFCAHFGEPEVWYAFSLAEQLGLNRKIQRFVHWMSHTAATSARGLPGRASSSMGAIVRTAVSHDLRELRQRRS